MRKGSGRWRGGEKDNIPAAGVKMGEREGGRDREGSAELLLLLRARQTAYS